MQKCLDYYDEALKVGDKVKSVIIDDKIEDDEGIITKIYFNPKNNSYYLTILNETGFLLTERKAQNYTTVARYEKYNPIEYTYFLDLDYFDHWRYEKVLDNNTHARIDFPSHSFMVVLYARYKTDIWDEYEFIPKFGFILDKDITIKYENGFNYLYKPTYNGKISKMQLFFPHQIFKTKAELIKALQELITYFKEAELSMFDSNMAFRDNEVAQEFDRELMRKLMP